MQLSHRMVFVAFLGLANLQANDPGSIKGYDPVSVSSANYRSTDAGELKQIIETSTLNADAPMLKALPEPVLFVFLPGEITVPDPKNPEPTYEEMCRLLTIALAKKGYINAADEFGTIRQPGKIGLLLRVNYGERDWRLPVVRTEQLAWGDGLLPKPKGRSLTTLGGDVLWDSRAGGNDRSLAAGAQNDANSQSFFGSGGGAPSTSESSAAALTAQGTGDMMGAYGDTRSFHLIVIDAFDYAEVKQQGKAAKRVWTTFVAAPKKRKQEFREVVGMLIRNATPYFGETSKGLQIVADARAEVTLGDLVVVPDDAPTP